MKSALQYALALAIALAVRAPKTPQLFAPNVISTAPLAELGGTFSPDGREFHFVVRTPTTVRQLHSSHASFLHG